MSEPGIENADRDGYSGVARLLHWAVAGAIVLQYVLANLADSSESRFREFVLLANHKSVGITILCVALLRLLWRFVASAPNPLPMPAWQRTAAAISHGSLYALMLLMPLTGWLMSSASNVPVSWFNLFQLPNLVGPGEDLAALFETTHETMAKILFFLALLHVVAALKHTLFDRDGALRRIASPVSLASFVMIVAAGLFFLVPEIQARDGASAESQAADDEPDQASANDAPPPWAIDYEASSIVFTAEQAGASFDGEWTDWSADIVFDATALESASFDVTVRVAGVATGDSDRDETLMDAEFFAASAHPTVRYQATDFEATANGGYVANGVLELKGGSHPVVLEFTVDEQPEGRVLEGQAGLDRLALGIGTGEWSDTAWIGQYVEVMVRVVASR